MLDHNPSALVYGVAATQRADLINAAARERLANEAAPRQLARHTRGRTALAAALVTVVLFGTFWPRVVSGETTPGLEVDSTSRIVLTIDEIRAYQRILEPTLLPRDELPVSGLTVDEMVFLDQNLLLPGGHGFAWDVERLG